MKLSANDQSKLDGLRIRRLIELFPILKRATLFLGGLDRNLIIVCQPAHIKQAQKQWLDIRLQSWFAVGAEQVSLYCGDSLLQIGFTLPKLLDVTENFTDPNVCPKLREKLTGEPMATATAERTNSKTSSRPRSAKQPINKSTIATIPTLLSLSSLANKTGIGEEQIAQEIQELNCLVFLDQGVYKAEEKGINAWVDSWLDRDREQRKAALLNLDISSNGKAATPTEPKPKSPRGRRAKTATPTPTETVKIPGIPKKFKSFKRSNSYSRTIDAFLSAQNWTGDNPTRVEIIEGVAGMATDHMPSKEGTDLPERCLARIVQEYAPHQRKAAARGLILAAKEMTGKATEPVPAENG